MNEVYLRGKLVSVYEPITPASQPKHLVYHLRVSHKTPQQQVKFENYTVNTWRNLAVWASSNLQVGMDVFIRGHLSQRKTSMGTVTEVTALTITPVMGRMTAAIMYSDNAECTAVTQNSSEIADAQVANLSDNDGC